MKLMSQYSRRYSARAWSNDQIAEIGQLLPEHLRIINVGGWLDEDKEGSNYRSYFREPSVYHVANYTGDKEKGMVPSDLYIDLTEPLPPDAIGQYNLSYTHTVLEHVSDPCFGFAQVAKLTSDLILTVLPWKQELHFSPGNFGDYHRLSPFVMRRLHQENGFEILWESYTPAPCMTTYLLYLGTKKPGIHKSFPRRLDTLEHLNKRVGSVNIGMLLENALYLSLRRLVSKVRSI